MARPATSKSLGKASPPSPSTPGCLPSLADRQAMSRASGLLRMCPARLAAVRQVASGRRSVAENKLRSWLGQRERRNEQSAGCGRAAS